MPRCLRLLLAATLFIVFGCIPTGPVEDQVREQLTKMNSFEKLSLQKSSDGGFTGTGTTKGGADWNIRVEFYANSKLKMHYRVSRGSVSKWGNIFIR